MFRLMKMMGMARPERWALVATLVVCIGGAAFTPPAHESIVDGQVVRDVFLFGHVIPQWLFFLVGVPIIALIWRGFYLLFAKLWPETKAAATANPSSQAASPTFTTGKFAYEKSYDRSEGGKVFWKPEVPGTPSPMDYDPPEFTRSTTAREFLNTYPPDASRFLIVGDQVSNELADFTSRQDRWIEQASETTLSGLIAVAEEIFAKPFRLYQHEVVATLWRANELRGIPSEADLSALASRVPHQQIAESLRPDSDG